MWQTCMFQQEKPNAVYVLDGGVIMTDIVNSNVHIEVNVMSRCQNDIHLVFCKETYSPKVLYNAHH